MIIQAAILLLAAGGFVLWPLLGSEPDAEPATAAGPTQDQRSRDLEDLELDVASGRLSREDADQRRREAVL